MSNRYLLIANPGEAPVDSFFLLGASMTRRDRESGTSTGTNGQFATGLKHAIALLVKNDLTPIVYAGATKLLFYGVDHEINDGLTAHTFRKIMCRISGRTAPIETNLTTEFGRDDWTDIGMGLREIITNALDRSRRESLAKGHDDLNYIKDVRVEVIDADTTKPRAKSGETRIYVPYSDEVKAYHDDLGRRFLHFSEPENLAATFLPKTARNEDPTRKVAVIYRDGVQVREIGYTEQPSLFDYNFSGSVLKIDEARNLEDHTVADAVGKALADADPETLAAVLREAATGETKFWELDHLGYSLRAWTSDSAQRTRREANWKKAWEIVSSDAVVCASNLTMNLVLKRGRAARHVKSDGLRRALQEYGVTSESSILTDDDHDGVNYGFATAPIDLFFEQVWDTLRNRDLTYGKDTPEIGTYTTAAPTIDPIPKVKNGVISIPAVSGDDNYAMRAAVLEGVAMHVTGTGAGSRAVLDFAIRVAALMFAPEDDRLVATVVEIPVSDQAILDEPQSFNE